jgi:hypothetical protein
MALDFLSAPKAEALDLGRARRLIERSNGSILEKEEIGRVIGILEMERSDLEASVGQPPTPKFLQWELG